MTYEHETLTMRKVYRRLVPFLFLLLVINYLDRVNIGFAALRMNQELGLSSTAFGFGAGVFFVGYALFEVPGNAVLSRIGARRWIGIILIGWGVASGAMAFVPNETSFYVLRFLVGAAEAGFMPGVIAYLATWFPSRYRSRANAGVVVATALASAIGSPMSSLLMKWNDGVLGMSGWRWMFIYEAMPAVLLGFVVFYWLTDAPERAKWLTQTEREWLSAELSAERRHLAATSKYSLVQVLKLRKVWALSALFSCFLCALYGVLLWAPQIVKSFGHLTDIEVGLLGSLPFCCAAIAMPLIARRSDRRNERRLHVAASMSVGGIALLLSACASNPYIAFMLLCVAAAGIWGSLGVFWSMTSTFLAGPAAALGIAVINTLAQVGGFIGPSSVGFIKDRTGSFSLALAVLAGFALLASLIAYRLDDSTTTQMKGAMFSAN
ncbi:Putative tartrate transporter [Pandoraea terrae]|uniref:Tartrate transporter n=1 Tax=Pandoraea terrae TaxID=1537710 RepID=A0A5E4X0F0_9BURK|nr:MFS transporter [Pandoraea terrae]VVE29743.1 Putative tartrate transporter [Pandoraea terrae]